MDAIDPPRPLTTDRPELLVDGSDAAFRRLIYGLLTMSARIDRLREKVGQLIGLSGFQYHILMVIAERAAERPVSVAQVAEALHTSGAYVTTETGKLARKGLIEKRPNPDDRRGVLLSLTSDGHRAIDAMAPHLRRINAALFDGFDESGFAAFGDIVQRMLGTTTRALATAELIAVERGETETDTPPQE